MSAQDQQDFAQLTQASYALAGAAARPDPRVVPVRGDLAHIRLAGQVFVPHYILPMPHRAKAPCAVLAAPGGEALAELTAGAEFHVLDMAGGYAWGEIPEGAVGYVALEALETVQ